MNNIDDDDFDITDLNASPAINFNYVAAIIFIIVVMMLVKRCAKNTKTQFRPNSDTSPKTKPKPRPLIAIDADGNSVELPQW